jgi:hypothetical protein
MQSIRKPALNLIKLVIYVKKGLKLPNTNGLLRNPTAKRKKTRATMVTAPLATMALQYDHHRAHVVCIRLLDTLMCWLDGKTYYRYV